MLGARPESLNAFLSRYRENLTDTRQTGSAFLDELLEELYGDRSAPGDKKRSERDFTRWLHGEGECQNADYVGMVEYLQWVLEQHPV